MVYVLLVDRYGKATVEDTVSYTPLGTDRFYRESTLGVQEMRDEWRRVKPAKL